MQNATTGSAPKSAAEHIGVQVEELRRHMSKKLICEIQKEMRDLTAQETFELLFWMRHAFEQEQREKLGVRL
jgi:hypothetical protein